MAQISECNGIILQKEAKLNSLKNLNSLIQSEVQSVITYKDSIKQSLMSVLYNRPLQGSQINYNTTESIQKSIHIGNQLNNQKENLTLLSSKGGSLLDNSLPKASVHDSVKKILQNSSNNKAHSMMQAKSVLNMNSLDQKNEHDNLFKLKAERTPLGLLNDGNNADEALPYEDASYQTFIKPKETVKTEKVDQNDEESNKVSILSDLPIREYTNMNANFTVSESDLRPDGKALRLSTLD